MILTHGSNSISRGGVFPTEVEIGGRKYPVVEIGNRLWMTESLQFADNNLTYTTSFNAGGNY